MEVIISTIRSIWNNPDSEWHIPLLVGGVFLILVLWVGLESLGKWLKYDLKYNDTAQSILATLMGMIILAIGAYVLVVLIKGSLIILYTPIPGWK
jgi:hypothetical protein